MCRKLCEWWASYDLPFREPEDGLLNHLYEDIRDLLSKHGRSNFDNTAQEERYVARLEKEAAEVVRDHRDRVEEALREH